MTVPPNITTPQQTGALIHTSTETTETTDSGTSSNLDRGVLNPSPCDYQIYTDVNSFAYETVQKVQPNIPLDSKGLNIPLVSKNPNNVYKYFTEKTYSTRDIGTLKLYANVIQSSVLYYQIIKKTFLSPMGIEPATDVLCHNISVALPTLLSSSYG